MRPDYNAFLRGPARAQWERLGLARRAGTCVPLFSLHSARSIGIGEFTDLKPMADWLVKTGQSLLQLLPLNDVGFDFAPYSAKSSFALDPMYLSLSGLRGVDLRPFKSEIAALAARFPIGPRVNYGIKGAKLELLRRIFERVTMETASQEEFRHAARYWLRDDALYKVLKDRHQGKSWEDWEPSYRDRDPQALAGLAAAESHAIAFHEWAQWQAFEQMRDAKAYAAAEGVQIMGDMPFLVARDSADVWAHPSYFKRHLSAGAPPDMYFAGGQRWGMPPYDWSAMAAKDYEYLREKLRYAENFYGLFRVDHVIGVFRLFTIPVDAPADRGGLDGAFDPPNENEWEEHGRRILSVMLESTSMLPCGEDLGVVPACSYKVLSETSIPGLEVQRWCRDWSGTKEFKAPESYRPNACAVASTHDMTPLSDWWTGEAGTVDDYFFRLKCGDRGFSYDALREKLFDPPQYGRLRWRQGMTEQGILEALGLPAESAQDFLGIFRDTFEERARYARLLGLSGEPPVEATPGFAAAALTAVGQTSAIFAVQLFFDWLALDAAVAKAGNWRVNLPGTVGPENWSVVSPLPLEKMLRWPVNHTIRRLNQKAARR